MTQRLEFSMQLAARRNARKLLSPDFSLQERRNATLILSAVEMTNGLLRKRENIADYYTWAIQPEHQRQLLDLVKQFDVAVERFNATANHRFDHSLYINTATVRSRNKLGSKGIIPSFLTQADTSIDELRTVNMAGMKTLHDQNTYMKDSERARTDRSLYQQIHKDGKWSEIHLNAKTPLHFWAMVLVDLYPGLLKRTERYGRKLDTDELVIALCEHLDPSSNLFRIIKDQGWFTEEAFSKKFLEDRMIQ